MERRVTVVGGGLAGSEAVWQLARRGHAVTLVEMRPRTHGPAHRTEDLAELVCSNSFKSDDPCTAAGVLKREMEELGSLILTAARSSAIPAGAALAVDRKRFSSAVTRVLEREPLVTIERREEVAVPPEPAVVATGPLTSPAFEPALSGLLGAERLSFFDAAAPVVEAGSIRTGRVFAASRHGKGRGDDYLNCPMERDEYERLVDELVGARRVEAREFETADLFSACQPVEEVARRGRDALRFGAMKPVGLTDPRTGTRPWAVVQLRPENAEATAYNLVGLQTNLAFGEQRRVFALVPGLEDAVFLRYGVMHRNTFVDAPRLLAADMSLRRRPGIWLAGQLTGTEGYLEAAATGLVAALGVHAALTGAAPPRLPKVTVLGALLDHVTDPATSSYQPTHAHFGLVPPLEPPVGGKRRRLEAYSERARLAVAAWTASRSDLVPADAAERASRAVGEAS